MIPSFGYGVAFAVPQSRSAFVSLSQKSASGRAVAGEHARAEPRVLGDERAVARAGSTASRPSMPHDQVLRNQSVGSTSSVAASGPALRTVIRMQHVVGAGLGVVDGDLEVAAVVEDPGVEELELRVELAAARFSATSRSYGNAACG